MPLLLLIQIFPGCPVFLSPAARGNTSDTKGYEGRGVGYALLLVLLTRRNCFILSSLPLNLRQAAAVVGSREPICIV